MKKHLRTSVAAFSVLALAAVGCETGGGGGAEDPAVEDPATEDPAVEEEDPALEEEDPATEE